MSPEINRVLNLIDKEIEVARAGVDNLLALEVNNEKGFVDNQRGFLQGLIRAESLLIAATRSPMSDREK